jgi:hypothetical protein
MRKVFLWALTALGLLVGLCAIAVASPATRLLDRDALNRTSSIEPAYHYWNHHRYRHRSWDRRHRRWRYY